MPVCSKGCDHGRCVRPEVCACNFGWTSVNCSVKCLCNEHGQCANETHLDVCHDCRNHTVVSAVTQHFTFRSRTATCYVLSRNYSVISGWVHFLYHIMSHTRQFCYSREWMQRPFSLPNKVYQKDKVVQLQ